jgi:hypothetical protein
VGAAGNVSATFTRHSSGIGAGFLVLAEFAPNAVEGNTELLIALLADIAAEGKQQVGLFDVRGLFLSGADSAILTFTVFSPDGLPPEITFIDPITEERFAVKGSTKVADSLTFTQLDATHFSVRVVLDDTSSPQLFFTPGTIFSIVVPQPSPPPAPVSQAQFLASLGGSAAGVDFELPFTRSAFASGSETTVATVGSQAIPLDAGAGGEMQSAFTEFVEDMVVESHRAFWRTLQRPDDPAPDGPGPTDFAQDMIIESHRAYWQPVDEPLDASASPSKNNALGERRFAADAPNYQFEDDRGVSRLREIFPQESRQRQKLTQSNSEAAMPAMTLKDACPVQNIAAVGLAVVGAAALAFMPSSDLKPSESRRPDKRRRRCRPGVELLN